MESEKRFVRKYYWVHQYEEEGDFLSDMRAQGCTLLIGIIILVICLPLTR